MHDVVVGVDQSESAHRAAVTAAELAAAYGVNLHVVTCATPASMEHVGVGSDQADFDWRSDAEQFLRKLVLTLPHDRVTTTVMLGDPASALCDEAKRLGADTIVTGSKRTQGVSRVLGSVAGDVVKKAPCNVMIAHTT